MSEDTTTDETAGQPVDMNALLRERDQTSTQAVWAARLFGTPEPDESSDDTDDGGTAA